MNDLILLDFLAVIGLLSVFCGGTSHPHDLLIFDDEDDADKEGEKDEAGPIRSFLV